MLTYANLLSTLYKLSGFESELLKAETMKSTPMQELGIPEKVIDLK
jgi:hypothetical protein